MSMTTIESLWKFVEDTATADPSNINYDYIRQQSLIIADAYEDEGKNDIAQALRELHQLNFVFLYDLDIWTMFPVCYRDFAEMMDHNPGGWKTCFHITTAKVAKFLGLDHDDSLKKTYEAACIFWWQLSQRTRSRIIEKYTKTVKQCTTSAK